MAKREARKRCVVDGCRRLQLNGSTHCRFHQEPKAETSSPADDVVKLTERDALRFGKVDAEVRNALQGQRLIDYEIDALRRNAQEKIADLQLRKAQLVAVVKNHESNYNELVQEIAESYGIHDPTKMAIDPDNGTVRNLANT